MIAMAVLAAGCAAGTSAARVGMEKDQTDVVFGFTPPTTPAVVAPRTELPPGVVGPLTVSGPAAAPAIQLPVITTLPTFPQFTAPVTVACPTAAPDAPIAGAATTSTDGEPAVGAYKWEASGSYLVDKIKVPLVSSYTQYVRNVAAYDDPLAGLNDPSFKFETVEPRINGGFDAFDWQEETDPTIPASPVGGLVLDGITLLSATGAPEGSYFTALGLGLLFIPLPVTPGGTWDSLSFDPTHGLLTLSGQVLTTNLVDACGTLLEAWHVHATLVDAGASATLDYLVAPQYGGQIISMAVTGSFLGVSYANAVMHTGQQNPSPLPAALR